MSDRTLFHFTSDRGAAGIKADKEIRPGFHHVIGERMIWLTSDPSAKPASLGLSRRRRGRFTETNRMAHRFEVYAADATPWSEARANYPAYAVEMLESAPGVKPDTWFVASLPISIEVESS